MPSGPSTIIPIPYQATSPRTDTMFLHYVTMPGGRTLSGLFGRAVFSNGRSEFLSSIECDRIIAHSGGKRHTLDLSGLTQEDLILLAEHREAVVDFVLELRAGTEARALVAEATAARVYAQAELEAAEIALAALRESAQGEAATDVPEGEENVCEPGCDCEECEAVRLTSTPGGVEALASAEDIELPKYQDMRADLAEAERNKEIDLNAVLGSDRTKDAITRAYVLLMLQRREAREMLRDFAKEELAKLDAEEVPAPPAEGSDNSNED